MKSSYLVVVVSVYLCEEAEFPRDVKAMPVGDNNEEENT